MNWLRQHWTKVRSALIGIVMVGLVLVGWTGVGLYRQRQATEAEIAARRQAEVTATISEEGQALTDKPRQILDFSTNSVTWNGKNYRRNTYIKALLCIGVDRSGEMTEATTTGFGGQSDGLYVIAQDTARGTIQILMIPRDTMTDITMTDLSGNVLGKNIQHITLAYAFGDGKERSCEFTREAVSDLLGGLPIDNYMAVDISVISVLNDAVGGVTVTVPNAGLETVDPSFIKGSTVHLEGAMAERFVRYRDCNQDHSALFRMNQQEAYITGYFDAVRKASMTNSQVVPQLFDQIQNYMITDMPKETYLKVALDAMKADSFTSDNIKTVPGTGVTTNMYDEFYADDAQLNEEILTMFYREES